VRQMTLCRCSPCNITLLEAVIIISILRPASSRLDIKDLQAVCAM